MDRGAWWVIVHRIAELDTAEAALHTRLCAHTHTYILILYLYTFHL